jgi:hypothetical protein
MAGRKVVYDAHPDFSYQPLLLYSSDEEFHALPALDGVLIGERWPCPGVFIEDYDDPDAPLPQPDIWSVAGRGGCFAMSDQIVERLDPFISASCELLPLRSVEKTGQSLFALHVLNPLNVHEVIDTTASYEDRARALERKRERILDRLSAEHWEAAKRDLREGELYPLLHPVFVEEKLPSVPTFFATPLISPGILHQVAFSRRLEAA